jgi:hypothetical protein
VPYVWTAESIHTVYANDSTALSFALSFRATFDYELDVVTSETEVANLFFLKNGSDLVQYISSVIAHKSGESPFTHNEYYPSITLGTKTFEEVYSNISFPLDPAKYIVYIN